MFQYTEIIIILGFIMNKQSIIFGGGCFWCVEAVFQRLKGVESVVSGYAGGEKDNPSYFAVSSGNTGHAEVIRVEFDPSVIPFETLLSVFFSSHDPTTINKQGNDVGEQYRSAIFYITENQKLESERFIQQLTEEKVFSRPIVTELKPLGKFFPAESYHQNYYNENKEQPYCQIIIEPKLAKLRAKFAHLLKE